MTPDQTEVILEEYVEMNTPQAEAGTEVPIGEMSVGVNADGNPRSSAGQKVTLSPEGEALARAVRAEMQAKLGVSAQTQ